jgi:signal transduction histidine kinase
MKNKLHRSKTYCTSTDTFCSYLCRSFVLFLFTVFSYSSIVAQDYEQIDSLQKVLDKEDITDAESAKLYTTLAGMYHQRSRDTAYLYSQKGYEHAIASKDNFLIAKSLIQISVKDIHGGNYDDGLSKLTKAEDLLSSITSSLDEEVFKAKILLYRNLGTVHNFKNQHKEAIESHLKALKLSEETDNLVEAGKAYYNIAVVHFSNQNYDRSLYYQNKAYETGIAIGDPLLESGSANLAGAIYFYTNKLDSAQIFSSKALAIARKNNLIQPSLEAANVLSSIHYQNERYDSALVYSKELLSISKEINDRYYIASLTGSIAKIYSQLKDVKNARAYYKEFEVINDSLGNLELAKLNYKNQAEFEKSIGNHELAYELLSNYFTIQDSIYHQENRAIQVDLETKYEAAKKDSELAIQQTTIERQRNQRNVLFGGGLLSLLAAAFFWNRKRTSTKMFNQQKELDFQKISQLKKEKKILAMNAMLEGQEAERMRIAKDLHDGLGGLLSTVKARLTKINNEVKKIESYNIYEKTTSMVDEACDEVRRISHNLLPGALRLDGVKTAIEQLGEDLSKSHPFDVNVEVIGFKHKLDETKDVFIYRIVQEAMNNIIKHAKAKQVLIQLSETDDQYHIIIEDDGVGFDTATESNGLGLKSIRSRVEHLQGELDISSKKDEGTTISIHIPKLKA